MEDLSFDLPPVASILLRRWREAAAMAHAAECEVLRGALQATTRPLQHAELKAAALELRRIAEEMRRDAFHASNFAAALPRVAGARR